MNLLDMLKEANIFSPTRQTTPQQFPMGSIGGPVDQSQSIPQSGGLDLNAAIQQLLTPQDQQFQNYSQMIQQMPQRADYQPSLLRRIGATLAGMGTGSPVGISNGAVLGYKSNIPEGLKVQSAISDEPYNKALTDWANKIEPTGKIAQMEQSRNVGNRATALGTLQKQQSQEKLDEQERRNLETERQGREKISIQKERADAYVKAKEFAQTHPEYKPFVNEDGNLVLYNPTDPTAEPIDTGVKKLSEMEKIDLGVQGDLKKIRARGDVSAKNTATRQATSLTNAQTLESQRQTNRIALDAIKKQLSKELSPSASRTERINKAIEIINARPELAKYLVHSGADGLSGAPTGEIRIPDGADPMEADFIRSQMGASNTQLPATKPQGSVVPQQNTAPVRELTRPAEDQRIKSARAKVEPGYVLITDGKSFGQVKVSDISKLPKGWMEVK